jgi:hypothetical protein
VDNAAVAPVAYGRAEAIRRTPATTRLDFNQNADGSPADAGGRGMDPPALRTDRAAAGHLHVGETGAGIGSRDGRARPNRRAVVRGAKEGEVNAAEVGGPLIAECYAKYERKLVDMSPATGLRLGIGQQFFPVPSTMQDTID